MKPLTDYRLGHAAFWYDLSLTCTTDASRSRPRRRQSEPTPADMAERERRLQRRISVGRPRRLRPDAGDGEEKNQAKEARAVDGSSSRLRNYHGIFIPMSGRGQRSPQIRARSGFPTIRSRGMRKSLIDREHTDTRERGLLLYSWCTRTHNSSFIWSAGTQCSPPSCHFISAIHSLGIAVLTVSPPGSWMTRY